MSDILILSIDIGFKNPGFSLITFSKDSIEEIKIFQNILFNEITDSIKYLNYFISQKINVVVLEKQYSVKNISLMRFIQGYFLSRKIKVVIKNPISYLNEKKNKTRSDKKNYSIELLRNVLEQNNIHCKLNSDFSDSINLGLLYISKLLKKDFKTFEIKIKNFKAVSF